MKQQQAVPAGSCALWVSGLGFGGGWPEAMQPGAATLRSAIPLWDQCGLESRTGQTSEDCSLLRAAGSCTSQSVILSYGILGGQGHSCGKAMSLR